MSHHTPIAVLFIGPQGCGKGTQLDLLKEYLSTTYPEQNVTHIQTGKPFRDLAARGGYTADLVKQRIEAGLFVPNVLTNALVVQEFVQHHTENAHVLFDGYPRDEVQAKTAEEIFSLYNITNLHVLYLDTPEDVVISRMMKRGRADDTEAVIAERLRQYKAVTMPLIAYYKNRPETSVHTIDGAADIASVQTAIRTALGI